MNVLLFSFVCFFFTLTMEGRKVWILSLTWYTQWPREQYTTGFITASDEGSVWRETDSVAVWSLDSHGGQNRPGFMQKVILRIVNVYAMASITEPWSVCIRGNLLRQKGRSADTEKHWRMVPCKSVHRHKNYHQQWSVQEGREDFNLNKWKVQPNVYDNVLKCGERIHQWHCAKLLSCVFPFFVLRDRKDRHNRHWSLHKEKSLCISKIQRLLPNLLKQKSLWMMTDGERECDISVEQGVCNISKDREMV